jgi:BirA family biotin operon repressor/biotin-[acetyl-CoA-carboxylase] ligase
MQETRRAILDELAGGPVAGPALAERLDVSRSAVWKHVEALREAGFDVRSGDDGYEIASVPEYGAAAVEFGLDAPYDVEFHDRLASTNAVARERAASGASNLVVFADEQTGGRGRRERSWDSPSGGVWMSVVVRPDVPPARVPLLTLAAAVAVTEAVRAVGVDAAIKWPNDVIVPGTGERGGRKLAGVLTEMAGESSRVSWVVVGTGLNANVPAADLPTDATSVSVEAGAVDRRELVQAILERFADLADDLDEVLPAWEILTATLGQYVRIETPTETFVGDAVDVTETGALVVEADGERRTVHAGDCEHVRPI